MPTGSTRYSQWRKRTERLLIDEDNILMSFLNLLDVIYIKIDAMHKKEILVIQGKEPE
jgi:hypothetical protein